MRGSVRPDSDPFAWQLAIAALFLLLCLVRITIPGAPYFDEVHYLPAARDILVLGDFTNREHPLFAKTLIALSIGIFGDGPLGWRVPSLVMGVLALLGAMRALWFATLSRFASLAYGVLVATGFLLFVHARTAMLDIFYLAFLALAFWQCAAAMREPETGRARLAAAGLALGLAMGSKWNAALLAAIPGLAFFALRLGAGRRRLVMSRRGAPVPGITLLEAALWLGLVPLAVYAATYLPAFFFERGSIGSTGGASSLVEHHREMIAMQASVVQSHPYSSHWFQWMLNIRGIWYLYEVVDGAQRGILLIGNPLTMLLGLVALGWAWWRGFGKGEGVPLAIALLYAASLGFWIVADKPVQFYYHYLLPSMFLLAALALALDALWQSGKRAIPLAVLGGSLAFFAYFHPILSAAPLDGPMAFLDWAWLPGWR